MLAALYADMAPPADAIGVSGGKTAMARCLVASRGIKREAAVRADVAGSQNADGTVAERVILVNSGDPVEVDIDTGREIAADLLAAADELEALRLTRTQNQRRDSSFVPSPPD